MSRERKYENDYKNMTKDEAAKAMKLLLEIICKIQNSINNKEE